MDIKMTAYFPDVKLWKLWNMCSRNRHAQELHEQTAAQDSNCHARCIHWKLQSKKNSPNDV